MQKNKTAQPKIDEFLREFFPLAFFREGCPGFPPMRFQHRPFTFFSSARQYTKLIVNNDTTHQILIMAVFIQTNQTINLLNKRFPAHDKRVMFPVSCLA